MSTTGETSTVPVVPTVTTTVSSIGSDAVNSTLPSSSPTSSTIVLAPLTMDPYSSDTLYTCRKCRSWLFRGNQINVHEVHKHSFSRHRLAKDLTSQGQTASTASSSSLSTSSSGTMDDSIDEQPSSSSSSSCTSYFLHEPLGWMKVSYSYVYIYSLRLYPLPHPVSNLPSGTFIYLGYVCFIRITVYLYLFLPHPHYSIGNDRRYRK